MTEPAPLRAVFDTNVVIATLLSRNPRSPLVELMQRWRQNEFVLLYCEDLLAAYREKVAVKRVEVNKARRFFEGLVSTGTLVEIIPADVIPRVRVDPDDDVVLACAIVGRATHLVTYDPHLHALGEEYQGVRILDGLHFLYALRGDAPPAS